MNKVPGTIVVQEKRTSKVKEKISGWWSSEMGKLDNMTPEMYDRNMKGSVDKIKIAGSAATLTLALCPADGPFGEILVAIATPLLAEIVEGCGKLLKPMLFAAQDARRKKLTAAHAYNGTTKTYVFDDKDFLRNAGKFVDDVKTYTGEGNTYGGRRAA